MTHNRITDYFVAARECDEDQRLKRSARTALAVEDLDAATLQALGASRMDSRYDHLDTLVD